jgi:hypothetical protein
MSSRLLLVAPAGAELMLDALVAALARTMRAQLLPVGPDLLQGAADAAGGAGGQGAASAGGDGLDGACDGSDELLLELDSMGEDLFGTGAGCGSSKVRAWGQAAPGVAVGAGAPPVCARSAAAAGRLLAAACAPPCTYGAACACPPPPPPPRESLCGGAAAPPAAAAPQAMRRYAASRARHISAVPGAAEDSLAARLGLLQQQQREQAGDVPGGKAGARADPKPAAEGRAAAAAAGPAAPDAVAAAGPAAGPAAAFKKGDRVRFTGGAPAAAGPGPIGGAGYLQGLLGRAATYRDGASGGEPGGRRLPWSPVTHWLSPLCCPPPSRTHARTHARGCPPPPPTHAHKRTADAWRPPAPPPCRRPRRRRPLRPDGPRGAGLWPGAACGRAV